MGRTKNTRVSLNFTRKSLEAIPIPTDKRSKVFDDRTRGLGLLIQPSGHRAFFWYRKVRGVPTWRTIGEFEHLSIEKAREKADELNHELAEWRADDYQGNAPKLQRRVEPTLQSLNDDYCERHLRSHAKDAERAISDCKRNFANHLAPWATRKLGAISRSDVRELHASIGEKTGRYAANRILQNFRAVVNWAISQEIWHGDNPAKGIEQFHEAKRTRFASPAEVGRLFAELSREPNQDVPDFILLSLLTGARKGNVAAMRWDNVTFETCSWIIPDPKNREPYGIALVPEAIDILKRRQKNSNSPWVFPSPKAESGHIVDVKKRWKDLLQRAAIQDFRPHDLRRTLGAWQAAQGASLPMIGKSLGHQSVAASAIYAPMQLDAVRSSVQAATSAMFVVSKTDKRKLLAQRKPLALTAKA